MVKQSDIDFEKNMKQPIHCGYVAIIGRPNVGKSTLLNCILGHKISITADKPQTTRYNILGIKTHASYQAIYVDTPGLQQKEQRLLNRYMNKAVLGVLADVDVIIFVVEGTNWKADDDLVLKKIAKLNCPIILAINKVDKVIKKTDLLSFIEKVAEKHAFAAIIPLAATSGYNVLELEHVIEKFLPEGSFLFPEEQITDRSDRFLAAEIIREKLTRNLGEELPYAISVVIEQFKSEAKLLHIIANIIVEKPGQKAIVIGKDGAVLKKIGTMARKDMEHEFGQKVFLQLWVKVKSNWADDERALKSFGFAM
ncbi:MAG: GTPase Era [Gammaproteobacteria bacterium]|nr:GTPase Era [Gammaproteobacteria bacterium]